MAQSSPLRNRTLYGTRDGVALSQGDAEAWRMTQARQSAPTPATAPAAPAAAAPSKWAARARLAGRAGGAVAGLVAEGARLGQIDAEQGPEAMRAELPRSAGRLGGAWAGAKVGGALGAMTGPAAPIATPAGAILGGGVGYAFGDDAVDVASGALPRVGRGIGNATAEIRNAGREGASYPEQVKSTAQAIFGGRARQAFNEGARAPAPDIKFRDQVAPPDSMFRRSAPPDIKFAGTDAAPASMFRMTPEEAAAVRAAKQSAWQPGANGASPPPAQGYMIDGNGRRREINADGTIKGDTRKNTILNQSFGGPTEVDDASWSGSPLRARASTWGLPANDPRMDSNYAGSAAARADALRAAGAPVKGGAQFAGMRGNFRDASQMGEYYNAKEDREARQKLLSDLDSQRFRLEMIAGNPGRRGRAAIDALGDNARQRAELATAGEKLSNDAVQNRYQRQNTLDNTGMEQSGAMDRTRLQEQGATQRTGMQEDGAMRRTMVDANSRYQAALAGAGARRRGEDAQTYADIAKGFGGDYTAAAQSVLRNRAAAGEDLSNDPLATMALTNLSDGVLASNGRMDSRGVLGSSVFGAGADGPVDPNPLNYTREQRSLWDRGVSAVLPWGANASDYLYRDAAGNKRYFDQPIFSDDPTIDEQTRKRVRAGFPRKE